MAKGNNIHDEIKEQRKKLKDLSFSSEGKEVMLNKGKTWICIVGADRYSKAEIYGK